MKKVSIKQNKSSVVALHEQTKMYAYPISFTKLVIRLRLQCNHWKRVAIFYRNKNIPSDSWKERNLDSYAEDSMLIYYGTTLETDETTRYLSYYFRFSDAFQTYYLNYYGLFDFVPTEGFFEYLYTNESDIQTVPQWAKGISVYQIFPDRFYPISSSKDHVNLTQWGEMPKVDSFYGGNLQGIIQKVPYLVSLGIQAVYLNPVFCSISNHRYDISDYYKIDPLLGTEEDLIHLADTLHDSNIKLLLDGVFNHCGVAFQPFQDVIKKGSSSTYYDWFYVQGDSININQINYDAIGYYSAMPKLCQSNPRVQDYFLEVAEYWTKALALDGWRFDVSDEVDSVFWQRMNIRLKKINPEILLIGEAWQENVELTQNSRLEGIIDYPFHRAAVDYFAKHRISVKEFLNRIGRSMGIYSDVTRDVNIHMLDCHDTARFFSVCEGDYKRMNCALVFLFTAPGIPLVYYGDEIGMQGQGDPDSRRTMEWNPDKQNAKLKKLYGQLIEIRKIHTALRTGSCSLVRQKHEIILMKREDSSETIVIAINMETTAETINMEELMTGRDLLTGKIYTAIHDKLTLQLNPEEAVILCCPRQSN